MEQGRFSLHSGSLYLYHKLPFGQLHSRNPAIIALAEKLGRGANSVAMKLNNFASLDPFFIASNAMLFTL